MSPVNSCCRKRPSSNVFISTEPVDSMGGLLGSIHSLVFVVQLPAKLASCLCGSPGVASFLYVSIMACGSICFSDFLSLASTGPVVMTMHKQMSVMDVKRIDASLWLSDKYIRLLEIFTGTNMFVASLSC